MAAGLGIAALFFAFVAAILQGEPLSFSFSVSVSFSSTPLN